MRPAVETQACRSKHVLYRFFDEEGRLLYIGRTVDLPTRLTHHRARRQWWDEVGHIALERFPTADALKTAERRAIIAERPLHNVIYSDRNRPGTLRRRPHIRSAAASKSAAPRRQTRLPAAAQYSYLTLAGILRDRIEDGTYPADSKLPSRAKLCEEFDVSDTVVGGALRELRKSRLTVSLSGSGTYVKRQPSPTMTT